MMHVDLCTVLPANVSDKEANNVCMSMHTFATEQSVHHLQFRAEPKCAKFRLPTKHSASLMPGQLIKWSSHNDILHS